MLTFLPNYVYFFVMEAQADATRCCVILLVQLSLEEGCNKGKNGGITPPNISTALVFIKYVLGNDTRPKMCVTTKYSDFFHPPLLRNSAMGMQVCPGVQR